MVDIGNEDPPEKKEKDQFIIDTALPEQSYFLCHREPMLNYADAELCGKWKVRSHPLPLWPSSSELLVVC